MDNVVGAAEKVALYERIGQVLLKTAPIFIAIEGYELIQPIRQLVDYLGKHGHVLVDTTHTDIGSLETDIGRPFLDIFLGAGLDLDLKDADQGMKDAWTRLARMVGFAIALPYAATALTMLGKFWFGERFSESVGETLGKLPEEFGLSWALGSMLDTLLERAVGIPLEELANQKFRPARLEWQQLRALLRAHAIDEKTLKEKLRLAGFGENDIRHLSELDRSLLSLGDLQQLYRYELIDKSGIDNYLYRLGYNKADRSHLITLYIDKASATFDNLYRSVARRETELEHITIDQYKAILEEGKLPPDEIRDDVRALKLEQKQGRISESMATIKARYQHGKHDAEHAKQMLHALGYSAKEANEIIALWDTPTAGHVKTLSASQILSYMAAGFIPKDDAYNRLIGLGYSDADASFLRDHPHARAGTHTLTVNYGTAVQAFIDGAISYNDLSDKLKELGANDKDRETLLKTAVFRQEHSRNSPGVKQSLNSGEIIKAFKYTIFDRSTAHDRLTKLGFDSDDATVLLEIENRGVFSDAPPLFASVDAAITYLENLGWKITPPPDPHLNAAEGMVLGAGYGLLPPASAV